jgi:SagB-type dehydrogenase family enzyme
LASQNDDIQATWRYHNGTKHPDGYLMNRWHRFDPSRRPRLSKKYLDLKSIPLPLDTSSLGIPALAAISSISNHTMSIEKDHIPDIGVLARLLYYSGGITKQITYPGWGTEYFRAAACTGALYHIELYVVCGELPGLAAGVYHFDALDMVLTQLRQGDFRRVLIEASGDEADLEYAPLILVYTDVFWRNACKYQAREYRHAFWDSGTILSHTLAMAAAHGLPARVVVGFVDDRVNQLLGLETEREVALALVPVGSAPDQRSGQTPELSELTLETLPISEEEIHFPPISQMHAASSLETAEEVSAWRAGNPMIPFSTPPSSLIPLEALTDDKMPQDPIEKVIVRRGSTRRFSKEAITFQQLSTILDRCTRGIPADFLPSSGMGLNQVYMIVNAITSLSPGSYLFHQKEGALERLKEGDFRSQAGYLGLNQALAAESSVDIFFLADLGPILERYGNRGYRAAQLEASITAGKMYLAAYTQEIGATGLTFYDDAVTEFFSPHAAGKSVMFLIAIGRKAKRR